MQYWGINDLKLIIKLLIVTHSIFGIVQWWTFSKTTRRFRLSFAFLQEPLWKCSCSIALFFLLDLQYSQYLACELIGWLLRTNSSKASFEEERNNFKKSLTERGYPINFEENVLSEVKHEGRKQSLAKKQKEPKWILPFVAQYHPAVLNLKQILMSKWNLIERQPLLKEIFEPPIISYRRGRSLKDELVRAKL